MKILKKTKKLKKLGSDHSCTDDQKNCAEKQMEIEQNKILIKEEKEDDHKILEYIKANPLKGVLSKEWSKSNKLKATHPVYFLIFFFGLEKFKFF